MRDDKLDEAIRDVREMRRDFELIKNFLRLADYASESHHRGNDAQALIFLEQYRAARMEHAPAPDSDG